MNINSAITKARRLLAKQADKTQNPAKIIILKHGEKPPKNMEGIIVIEVLPEANMTRSL